MTFRIIGALFLLFLMCGVTFVGMFVYPRNPHMLKELTVSGLLTGTGSIMIAVGFLMYGNSAAPYLIGAGLLDYLVGFVLFMRRRLRGN